VCSAPILLLLLLITLVHSVVEYLYINKVPRVKPLQRSTRGLFKIYRGKNPALQVRVDDGYGVMGDRCGVTKSHPRCHPCPTLRDTEGMKGFFRHFERMKGFFRYCEGMKGFSRPHYPIESHKNPSESPSIPCSRDRYGKGSTGI
jgi:hypothetical protein